MPRHLTQAPKLVADSLTESSPHRGLREGISAIVRRFAVASLLLAACTGSTAAFELITAQEASLPDAVETKWKLGFRGVSRGPNVQVISPAPDAGLVRSPLNLRLRFETHGGAVIDPQLVKIIYLKNPAINLTQRIGDLIKPDGLEIDNATVPPGTHYIRVEIKDSVGRFGSTMFVLMVAE
jgi:hypothetical protein